MTDVITPTIKAKLLEVLDELSKYAPEYIEGFDNGCSCCREDGDVEMIYNPSGEWVSIHAVRAKINEL